MAFPDFPFDPSLPSFLHHSDVLAYLESYADHFCVREHIRGSVIKGPEHPFLDIDTPINNPL
ncbi:hypothetical protein UY3_18118 [Chelonia mydas]|uniref:Flavin-containing monooxygenase n=1 Tax=Chelonia mydas TaxID=8469 RepID=M7AII7_CHEMY|nr:hypothetical protein UY3_18118 [Chelonia mydas]